MSESKFTALPTFAARTKKANKPKPSSNNESLISIKPIIDNQSSEQPVDISSLSLNITSNTINQSKSTSAIASLLPTIDTVRSPIIRPQSIDQIMTVNPSRTVPIIERSIVSLPVPFNVELYGSYHHIDPKQIFSTLSPDDLYVENRRAKTLSQ